MPKAENSSVLHLRISKKTIQMLKRQANAEQRTMHNLAILLLEGALERRIEASAVLDGMLTDPMKRSRI